VSSVLGASSSVASSSSSAVTVMASLVGLACRCRLLVLLLLQWLKSSWYSSLSV
jgi:hypothetical protein